MVSATTYKLIGSGAIVSSSRRSNAPNHPGWHGHGDAGWQDRLQRAVVVSRYAWCVTPSVRLTVTGAGLIERMVTSVRSAPTELCAGVQRPDDHRARIGDEDRGVDQVEDLRHREFGVTGEHARGPVRRDQAVLALREGRFCFG